MNGRVKIKLNYDLKDAANLKTLDTGSFFSRQRGDLQPDGCSEPMGVEGE